MGRVVFRAVRLPIGRERHKRSGAGDEAVGSEKNTKAVRTLTEDQLDERQRWYGPDGRRR